MTTYNAAAVSNAVIAHKKAPTVQTVRALRDNPLAVAEGSPDAPRVVGRALDTHLGELAITATPSGFIDLDLHEIISIQFSGVDATSTATLRARYTSDNGATWGPAQDIGNFSGFPDGSGGAFRAPGYIRLNLRTGAYVFYCMPAPGRASGTHTVPADCNGFQLSATIGTSHADCYCLGGVPS